jgi:aspartokinase-like uncharacterized kinase
MDLPIGSSFPCDRDSPCNTGLIRKPETPFPVRYSYVVQYRVSLQYQILIRVLGKKGIRIELHDRKTEARGDEGTEEDHKEDQTHDESLERTDLYTLITDSFMMDPLVVKIGGSLLASVPELVRVIRTFPRAPILIVPGGGSLADQVRSLAAPEDASHWMAVAAMEQYGWYIASHGLPITESLQVPDSATVFLPYRCMRDQDPLPHTWDVTSDTIAAWIASVLHADLVLLKAVDGLFQGGAFRDEVRETFPCLEVDAAFLPYVLSHHIRCTILNGTTPDLLIGYLRGTSVHGTRVGTRF